MPRGPWLLVVGMHRSGTSAVTGALHALGFQAAQVEDRMDWPESNPEHWESLSLALHDDVLLHHLEGNWDAPPELGPGWERSTAIAPVPPPQPVAAGAYPQPGPLVWKDPRICLLLPYWASVIPAPLAAVFVWRSPVAVARSLQARDGLSLAHGLALWERYNRSAITNLAGIDTYVIEYDTVMDDPAPAMDRIADWLSVLPQFAPVADRWEPAAMAAHLTPSRRHQSHQSHRLDAAMLLPSHQQLIDQLAELTGGHRPLEPMVLPQESGWSSALLEDRRQLWLRSRRVGALEADIAKLHLQLNGGGADSGASRHAERRSDRALDVLVAKGSSLSRRVLGPLGRHADRPG